MALRAVRNALLIYKHKHGNGLKTLFISSFEISVSKCTAEENKIFTKQ